MKTNKFNNYLYNKSNSSVNEWSNSIYNFDKNKLNTFWSSKTVFNVFNSYFNIKPNHFLSKKVNILSSLKRIFVGLPEIKISLNKVNIFLYVFNKEFFIIKNKIIKLNNLKSKQDLKFSNIKKNKFSIISNKNFLSLIFKLKNNKFSIMNNKKPLFNLLNNFNSLYNYNVLNILYKKLSTIIINNKNYKNSYKYNNFYKTMENIMEKTRITKIKKYYILFFYKRYVTRLYFNKLKFNSINLFNLNKILYKIYNKPISINIINLKYLYLDNSIYINAIVRKLKETNRKVLRVLRKALILPKLPELDSMFLKRKEKGEIVSKILYTVKNHIKINKIYAIFESLKNIHVIGMRLEGKGRLTRRLTASRAVYKKAYKGNLKNVYSSNKGLSALMLNGYNKSNLNYTNLNSYNRNGSYGIKSWQNTV